MKKYSLLLSLTVFLFGASLEVKATHVAGAEISYRYIGDSTGIPRQYQVILLLYRDMTPGTAGLGATVAIDVRSSCFANSTFTATRVPGSLPDGGQPTPGYDDCVLPSAPGYVAVSMHKYRGTTILPQNCASIIFSYDICCRSGCIDNLAACAPLNCGGNCPDGTYVEAFLNNINGQNTSPQFLTAAAKAFCTNSYFVWTHPTFEPNNDSVVYSFTTPMEGPPPGFNLPFAGGYSVNQPITTAPGSGGIQVNSLSGTFSFTTSTNQEICVAAIIVKEYRFNQALQTWEYIGSSMRDMQLTIAGNCNPAVQNGPRIDISLPGFGVDTISGDYKGDLAGVKIINDSIVDPNSSNGFSYIVPTLAYNCGDSIITLRFDVDIQCTSVSPDGTDFRVIGPDSIARPVVGVKENCGIDFTTDFVELKLYKPLTLNGEYIVYIKQGNDGNTLTNECGFQLEEFYTMMVKVDNCFEPTYAVRNVTVDTNWTTRVQYEVDTLSYPKHLTTGVNFFRSDDNGATWNKVGTKFGMNSVRDPQWTDFSVGPGDVEARNYRYAIQPIVNQEVYNPSANITSIRIDTVFNGNAAVKQLAWNRYNGWLNVNYEVMVSSTPEDANSWVAVSGQGINPTIDTSFSFTLPTDSGCYALRVSGIRLGNPTYVSHSNWEQFCVFEEDSVIIPPIIDEPDSIIVANVFTPNGDLINDQFSVQNIEDYDEASLSIFNRWGNQIYASTDYINEVWDGTDQNSGGVVADGVYFYVLSIKHYGTQYSEQFQGSVTVFSGGAK